MYRTHTCGELRATAVGHTVTIAGWVKAIRDKGTIVWIDIRDRYGTTQVVGESGEVPPDVLSQMKALGRECVVQITGEVVERYSKNPNNPTGDIEIKATAITLLNSSKTPPFTIENETDGGEALLMKYRYLDLRRPLLQQNLQFRHQVALELRKYMDALQFLEIETPYLMKSTPEGARDFVVPSRMNPGEFYALPQSPQTFKQLLMVAGYDRYYQLVKCFRDEDLRSDRQPEFTQIDCEMTFVDQEDVIRTFEGLINHLFTTCKNRTFETPFPRMTYAEAMRRYGSDRPDIRFDMELVDLNAVARGKGFKVFDKAEQVVGISVKAGARYSRKQLDKWTDWVKQPQIGAKGMVYCKCNEDGTYKSSVDQFFSQDDLANWARAARAEKGDLLLLLSGKEETVRKQMGELRLHIADELGWRDPNLFRPLWIVDFPLLEWSEETQRYHAMHHPFTSPKKEDIAKLKTSPGEVRANAYDLTMNGVELGGGSIRIHDKSLQDSLFELLGFSEEERKRQFGFLMDAFEFGAPPHGGIAFGFDRIVAMMSGSASIRDYIAFPKNNSGRDVMIAAPSKLEQQQLQELNIQLNSE